MRRGIRDQLSVAFQASVLRQSTGTTGYRAVGFMLLTERIVLPVTGAKMSLKKKKEKKRWADGQQRDCTVY